MAAANRQTRHLPAFILLELSEGPLHGHAIRTALTERFPDHKFDPGATYRTLSALEEAGEVDFHWDTDSRGPARKIYTLTPLGWERLAYWRSEMENRLAFLQDFLNRYDRAKARR